MLIWWVDNISKKLAGMKPIEKIEDIKELVVNIKMNGRSSARKRRVDPPIHTPKTPVVIKVNKPIMKRIIEPKVDNKGLTIPIHDSLLLSSKHLNKPMPNLNVKPRIDNKGIKSPLRSPLLSPRIVNKALPNFSLVSPKIDNKGLNIVKHEINKIKLKLTTINSEKDLVQKKNNENVDPKIPETLITPPTPVKHVDTDENYVYFL